jgi:phenylpropionate dioxygenase-like ring-hydroxylating dioxygenase large terminal subunit
MFINFWYPLARAQDLVADKPMKVTVLGQNLVVFRDSKGEAHCLSNVCTHRGGNLAGGKVKGDTVECPYHGWRFNGGGECVKIPSIGKDGKIPGRTRIDAYPVQEKYGIVFGFLGDLPAAERPGIYEIPEYGQEGWRANEVMTFDVNYNYERSIENGLDPAHNEFVHPTHGYSGEKEDYALPNFDVVENEQGCHFWMTFKSPPLKDATMNKARNFDGDLKAGAGHYGPNALQTWIHMTDTNWMHQYFFEAPVNENQTKIFFVNMRNCLLEPMHDAKIHERNIVIADQDVVVLEAVEPVITPKDMTHEVMMPADRVIVRYRQILKEWEAKGWRIDTEKVNATKGQVAYAIPSPARRDVKGWALDPVPTVQPAGEAVKQAAE